MCLYNNKKWTKTLPAWSNYDDFRKFFADILKQAKLTTFKLLFRKKLSCILTNSARSTVAVTSLPVFGSRKFNSVQTLMSVIFVSQLKSKCYWFCKKPSWFSWATHWILSSNLQVTCGRLNLEPFKAQLLSIHVLQRCGRNPAFYLITPLQNQRVVKPNKMFEDSWRYFFSIKFENQVLLCVFSQINSWSGAYENFSTGKTLEVETF